MATKNRNTNRNLTATERQVVTIGEKIGNGDNPAEVLPLIMALDPDKLTDGQLPDDLVSYVRQHAHLYGVLVSEAEQTAAEREQVAAQAKSAFEQAKDAKESALKAHRDAVTRAADRARDRDVFAFRAVKVHKIYSNGELASVWGVSRAKITKMCATVAAARELGAKSGKQYETVRTAYERHGVVLREVVAAGGKLADLESRVSADKATAKATRSQQESDRGESETVGEAAFTHAAKLTNALGIMVKTGELLPDRGDDTGDMVIERLIAALDAYRAHAAAAREKVAA